MASPDVAASGREEAAATVEATRAVEEEDSPLTSTRAAAHGGCRHEQQSEM